MAITPAAMRYTEVRLARAASLLLDDIDQDTVDFQPNYDETENEPKVLPARFPNLLINGGNGIAVGMATNIPPHNPGEVIDATLALIAEPDLSLDELMQHRAGPGFPNRRHHRRPIRDPRGLRDRPRIHHRSAPAHEFEEMARDREAIIITEIPYQVNKKTLLERIGELVREKQIEGISGVRDESDRSGMRDRDRTEARCDARGGAEPALPLHPIADHVRHQHAGAGHGPAAPAWPA